MKKHPTAKPHTVAGETKRDQGYDEGVRSAGAGLDDQGELIAPPEISEQLDAHGLPVWDDSERAAPLTADTIDGREMAVPRAATSPEISREELRRRARALGIPGRSRMTKMQLAVAVSSAVGA